jgi:hypothetical protein
MDLQRPAKIAILGIKAGYIQVSLRKTANYTRQTGALKIGLL